MQDNGGSNGNGKAWDLLVAQVGRIETSTTRISTQVTRLETRLDGLTCAAHSTRLVALEKAVTSRLGWKSLMAAAIPALVAGLMLGARLL